MADETAPPTTNTTTDPAAKQRKKEFWNNIRGKLQYGTQRGGGLGGKAALMGAPIYMNRGGAAGDGQFMDYGADYDRAKMLQEYQAKQRAKTAAPVTGGPGPALDPAAQPAAQAAAPMMAEPQSLAEAVAPQQQATSTFSTQGKSKTRKRNSGGGSFGGGGGFF